MTAPIIAIESDEDIGLLAASPSAIETRGEVSLIDNCSENVYYIFNTDPSWPTGSDGQPITSAVDNTATAMVPSSGYILFARAAAGPSLTHTRVTKTGS